MDGVSNQIMFSYSLKGESQTVQRIPHDWSVLAKIEGELVIVVGNDVFFRDDFLLLLEFAIDLLKWRSALSSCDEHDFEYFSMDHDEGPILTFKRNSPLSWVIESPWSEKGSAEEVEFGGLVSTVDAFLADFTKQLNEKYRLDLNKFHN